jgi:hypothetical protein
MAEDKQLEKGWRAKYVFLEKSEEWKERRANK